jgi:hypothetical protein
MLQVSVVALERAVSVFTSSPPEIVTAQPLCLFNVDIVGYIIVFIYVEIISSTMFMDKLFYRNMQSPVRN